MSDNEQVIQNNKAILRLVELYEEEYKNRLTKDPDLQVANSKIIQEIKSLAEENEEMLNKQ